MKWVYMTKRVLRDDALEDIVEDLNKLGEEGWEVAAYDSEIRIFFLKRQVPR